MIELKRLFAGMTAALLAVISLFSIPTQAISARSAVVVDCTTGRILYSRNCDEKSLIASTTKIMTALVVCEQCNVLDRVMIPSEAVGIEGSSLYLKTGEILTVQELLYGMMLHSGNDAATALAIYCAGTVEEFAQRMNDKARGLGMKNSHFVNPHGLDSADHYSTAEDLAILTSYAMENPIFQKVVSTKTINIGQRQLRNHNKLLWQLDYVDGVKTGYTKAAGRILVSSGQKDGRRLVAVTIGATDDWNDHISLLENSYAKYRVREVIEKDQILGFAQVAGGTARQVQLKAEVPFAYALTEGEEPQIHLPKPGFVYAPIAAGQKAGFAQVFLDGKLIGKVPLIYGETVEMEEIEKMKKKRIWDRLLGGND